MAYPAERENVEFKKYLERHDLGEEDGPRLTIEEWRKKRKEEKNGEDNKSSRKATMLTGR